VPFGVAAIWMILWGQSSTKSGERLATHCVGLDGARHGATSSPSIACGHGPAAGADRRRHLCQQGAVLALARNGWALPPRRPAWRRSTRLATFPASCFNYLTAWIQRDRSFPLALMPIALVATIGTVCVLVTPSSSENGGVGEAS